MEALVERMNEALLNQQRQQHQQQQEALLQQMQAVHWPLQQPAAMQPPMGPPLVIGAPATAMWQDQQAGQFSCAWQEPPTPGGASKAAGGPPPFLVPTQAGQPPADPAPSHTQAAPPPEPKAAPPPEPKGAQPDQPPLQAEQPAQAEGPPPTQAGQPAEKPEPMPATPAETPSQADKAQAPWKTAAATSATSSGLNVAEAAMAAEPPDEEMVEEDWSKSQWWGWWTSGYGWHGSWKQDDDKQEQGCDENHPQHTSQPPQQEAAEPVGPQGAATPEVTEAGGVLLAREMEKIFGKSTCGTSYFLFLKTPFMVLFSGWTASNNFRVCCPGLTSGM